MAPRATPDHQANMLNIDRASQRLGVSTHSVRRLATSGRLAGAKYLGRWFFTEADIDNYISAHRSKVAA
jgi:predicted site-specific integrase-resolvase